MKYKHYKIINCYKTLKLYEYAIIFSDSDQLINYVCHLNSSNITSSSLFSEDAYYLLLSTYKPLITKTHATFQDKLHITEIKSNAKPICKRDAVHKMQKAFIKP